MGQILIIITITIKLLKIRRKKMKMPKAGIECAFIEETRISHVENSHKVRITVAKLFVQIHTTQAKTQRKQANFDIVARLLPFASKVKSHNS